MLSCMVTCRCAGQKAGAVTKLNNKAVAMAQKTSEEMKLINNYLNPNIRKGIEQQRKMLQRLNLEQKTSSQLAQQHMPKRNSHDFSGNTISSSLIISYMRR